MSSKHTKGPWTVERVDHDDCITYEIGPKADGTSGFRFVLRELNYNARDFGKLKADSERIVACVNACEGLEDPSTLKLVQRLMANIDFGLMNEVLIRTDRAVAKAEKKEIAYE